MASFPPDATLPRHVVAPPRDLSPEALADAIGRMLSDPQSRAAMGRAGYRRVRDVFGLKDHVERICRIYRRLLAGR